MQTILVFRMFNLFGGNRVIEDRPDSGGASDDGAAGACQNKFLLARGKSTATTLVADYEKWRKL